MKEFPTNSIIIRYGEIALKGKNRNTFEQRLLHDVRYHFQHHHHPFSEIELIRGRIYVHQTSPIDNLQNVLGVLSYSPAWEIDHDYQNLIDTITSFFPIIRNHTSFRISCQRSDKRFQPDSPTIEREIGHLIHEATHIPVNLEKPGITLSIEIGIRSIFLFLEKKKGYGGFPFGSAGKLVSLFSGGIDSPVATFLMMKRGVEVVLVHFRITSDNQEIEKITALKNKLEEYTAGRKIPIYIIDRNELFSGRWNSLYQSRYQPYLCLLCKYAMHKKALEIAKIENAFGIITGDNLAQVASQTLPNLRAQRFFNSFPIYSPLIAFEKTDIIQWARNIGTFDVSIQYEKGCQPPAHPKTSISIDRFLSILQETGLAENIPESILYKNSTTMN